MKTQDVLKPILFSPTLISIYREIRRMIIVTMVFVGLKHYHFISSWYWALSPLWLTLLIDEARMMVIDMRAQKIKLIKAGLIK
jgi:hypothetical protein